MPALLDVRVCEVHGSVERVVVLFAVHPPARRKPSDLQLLGLGESALLAVRVREIAGGSERVGLVVSWGLT